MMRVGFSVVAVSHGRVMACLEDATELMRLFVTTLHTVGSKPGMPLAALCSDVTTHAHEDHVVLR